jgi:hypothetical protein
MIEADTNVAAVIYASAFDRTLADTENSGPADLDRLAASLDYMKHYFCRSTPDEAGEAPADRYPADAYMSEQQHLLVA